ncbi:MAG TPA: hypothetical protein DHV48_03480 [Prolixibacteraceae bacterium]|nr:hypothetical protein [Prolixibacteraceae bacterium]
MKLTNKIFTTLFAVIAIAELIGFLTGHGLHCLMVAVFAALLAILFYTELKRKPIKNQIK